MDTNTVKCGGPASGGCRAFSSNRSYAYNTDHQNCDRTMDQDTALGSSPGPDITMAVGGKQPPMSTISSLPLPLQILHSPQYTNLSASLSLSLPFPHHVLAHQNGAQSPGTTDAREFVVDFCLPRTSDRERAMVVLHAPVPHGTGWLHR